MSTLLRPRREWLTRSTSALLGAGLAACGGSSADTQRSKPAFVLVHGAWHNASSYTEVIAQLAALGHAAVALDLPGHGLRAKFPSSWLARPFDARAFATEPTPLVGITLADYVTRTLEVIDQVRAQGYDKVVLVGHSFGGNTITMVGEQAPEKLSKLVYLAAFLPFNGKSALEVTFDPAGAASQVPTVLVADPTVIGAQRMDPNSPDPTYRAKIKSTFYGDVSDDAFAAMSNTLTPDEPNGPALQPMTRTAARWGSIERHYVKCLQDNALVPPHAQKMIDTADTEFPQRKTVVHTMDTSHSPFLSQPAALARLLASIAT